MLINLLLYTQNFTWLLPCLPLWRVRRTQVGQDWYSHVVDSVKSEYKLFPQYSLIVLPVVFNAYYGRPDAGIIDTSLVTFVIGVITVIKCSVVSTALYVVCLL